MQCEILAGKLGRKAERILSAMHRVSASEGISSRRTNQYKNCADWYMTWGPGHKHRREWTDRHLANGGHVIYWDLGYWDRKQKFRVTIDADHPQKLATDMPNTRSKGIVLRDDYDPNGPIIIIGMGPKSMVAYDSAKTWEAGAIARAKRAYPTRKIIVRPKGQDAPIDRVLRGASLVVCRHSNVAVDACIANIPVVCEDGIGASLYSNDIHNPVTPDQSQRKQFIANVGWWQWAPSEAREAWKFIKDRINAAGR